MGGLGTRLKHTYLDRNDQTPAAIHSAFGTLQPEGLVAWELRSGEIETVDVLQTHQRQCVEHQKGGGVVEGLRRVHPLGEVRR